MYVNFTENRFSEYAMLLVTPPCELQNKIDISFVVCLIFTRSTNCCSVGFLQVFKAMFSQKLVI